MKDAANLENLNLLHSQTHTPSGLFDVRSIGQGSTEHHEYPVTIPFNNH